MTISHDLEKSFRHGKRRVILAAIATFVATWLAAAVLGAASFRLMTNTLPATQSWLMLACVALVPATIVEHMVAYQVAKRTVFQVLLTLVAKNIIPQATAALAGLVFAVNPFNYLGRSRPK
jgi:hypothetical protein